jgi:hypothetical protein
MTPEILPNQNEPSQNETAELEAELFLGVVQGTLTEQRYDEILAVLLPYTTFPEARASLISCGKSKWREKYLTAPISKSTAA